MDSIAATQAKKKQFQAIVLESTLFLWGEQVLATAQPEPVVRLLRQRLAYPIHTSSRGWKDKCPSTIQLSGYGIMSSKGYLVI